MSQLSDPGVVAANCGAESDDHSLARPETPGRWPTMRPPYRRGPGYTRCGLRLRTRLYNALRTESRRRRQWVSVLSQDLLEKGLECLRGKPIQDTKDRVDLQLEDPETSARHWVRLAIERPIWDLLQLDADRRRISVGQLIRQMVGGVLFHGSLPDILGAPQSGTVAGEPEDPPSR
jgi:hypothetical protein